MHGSFPLLCLMYVISVVGGHRHLRTEVCSHPTILTIGNMPTSLLPDPVFPKWILFFLNIGSNMPTNPFPQNGLTFYLTYWMPSLASGRPGAKHLTNFNPLNAPNNLQGMLYYHCHFIHDKPKTVEKVIIYKASNWQTPLPTILGKERDYKSSPFFPLIFDTS